MTANRIRLGREQRLGLTQRELALILDVDSMAVSRWERGVSVPSMKNLRRLAEVYGEPVSWFFEENGA